MNFNSIIQRIFGQDVQVHRSGGDLPGKFKGKRKAQRRNRRRNELAKASRRRNRA